MTATGSFQWATNSRHGAEAGAGLAGLRGDTELADLLLTSGTGQQLSAHTTILALASPMLRTLLTGLPYPQPRPAALYLDLQPGLLEPLLDYIYTGEARVAAGLWEQFLAAGRRLGLRGLAGSSDEEQEEEDENEETKFEEEKEEDYLSQSTINLPRPNPSRLGLPQVSNIINSSQTAFGLEITELEQEAEVERNTEQEAEVEENKYLQLLISPVPSGTPPPPYSAVASKFKRELESLDAVVPKTENNIRVENSEETQVINIVAKSEDTQIIKTYSKKSPTILKKTPKQQIKTDTDGEKKISSQTEIDIKGSKRFACHKCDAAYKSKLKLKIHINKKHNIGDRKGYKCEECHVIYKSKQNLKIHIDVKHKNIRFPCDQCKKKFKTKITLKRHMITHHHNSQDATLKV